MARGEVAVFVLARIDAGLGTSPPAMEDCKTFLFLLLLVVTVRPWMGKRQICRCRSGRLSSDSGTEPARSSALVGLPRAAGRGGIISVVGIERPFRE